MHRFLTTALLGLALLAPVALKADNGLHKGQYKHKAKKQQRYYDRNAKDWHEWNDNESQSYNRYLQENRLQQQQWNRANTAQQRAYWKWRHDHPESSGDRR